MTHDEMIAVIQAHKDGKTIQHYVNGWVDKPYEMPSFNFGDYIYRVKPEPRVRYMIFNKDGITDGYAWESFIDVSGRLARMNKVGYGNTYYLNGPYHLKKFVEEV